MIILCLGYLKNKPPFMTAIEQHPDARIDRFDFNPYGLDSDSPQHRQLVDGLISDRVPSYHKGTNPDIGEALIFEVSTDDIYASLARALEGKVVQREWGQEPDDLMDEEAAIEDGSKFFIYVDPTSETPIQGMLRIVDCEKSLSETEQFFDFAIEEGTIQPPNIKRPSELVSMMTPEGRKGVWDVVSVFTDPVIRGDSLGAVSSWLYHAFYSASVREGVTQWISNVTDKEYRNLINLGIPFKPMEGEPESIFEDNGKSMNFSFVVADAMSVGDAVEGRARDLSDARGMRRRLGERATIARFGSETLPTS